jgi:hypothetical protein
MKYITVRVTVKLINNWGVLTFDPYFPESV